MRVIYHYERQRESKQSRAKRLFPYLSDYRDSALQINHLFHYRLF